MPRSNAARRRVAERGGGDEGRRSSSTQEGSPESWPELHEEIARLPERYREPVVLCYLEGLSTEEAALRIGCPQGTVLSRLSRARERLRGRLERRGLALPAAVAGAAMTPPANGGDAGRPAPCDGPGVAGFAGRQDDRGRPGLRRGNDTGQGSAPRHDDLPG